MDFDLIYYSKLLFLAQQWLVFIECIVKIRKAINRLSWGRMVGSDYLVCEARTVPTQCIQRLVDVISSFMQLDRGTLQKGSWNVEIWTFDLLHTITELFYACLYSHIYGLMGVFAHRLQTKCTATKMI